MTRYPIVDMSSPAGDIEYTRFPQAGEANPIVRVGVVPVAGGETKWMDTGANTDVYLARVDWLRDSQQIAIQRLNRGQKRTRFALLRRLERRGAESPDRNRQILDQHQRRSVFLQRRQALSCGRASAPAFATITPTILSGKELAQFTSGDWAITGTSGFGPGAAAHPAVDEAHGYIYFLSNKDNVPETQLYRVSLADKRIERITKQPGTHDVIIAPDDSAFVDEYSNVMTPPRQDLYRADGTQWRRSMKTNWRAWRATRFRVRNF